MKQWLEFGTDTEIVLRTAQEIEIPAPSLTLHRRCSGTLCISPSAVDRRKKHTITVVSDDQNQRWQYPAYSSCIELKNANAAKPFDVEQQQAGYEIARDDKKNVDAGESTNEARNPGVIGDDRPHRYRTEAIDVGTIFWLARNIAEFLQSRRQLKTSKMDAGLVLLKGVNFSCNFGRYAVSNGVRETYPLAR